MGVILEWHGHGLVKAIDADGFLSRTFELHPSEALAVLRNPRKAYTHPPFSPLEFVHDLTVKRLTRLAAQTDKHRDELEERAWHRQ